jgi:hypothetical protein
LSAETAETCAPAPATIADVAEFFQQSQSEDRLSLCSNVSKERRENLLEVDHRDGAA